MLGTKEKAGCMGSNATSPLRLEWRGQGRGRGRRMGREEDVEGGHRADHKDEGPLLGALHKLAHLHHFGRVVLQPWDAAQQAGVKGHRYQQANSPGGDGAARSRMQRGTSPPRGVPRFKDCWPLCPTFRSGRNTKQAPRNRPECCLCFLDPTRQGG